MQLTYDEIRPIADVAAAAWGLQAAVLMAIWWLESTWNPNAVNQASWATGLGGVLSHESAAIYGSVFESRPTVEELKDPETNANWSAMILANNLDACDDDLRCAVKRYSGGWGTAGDDAFERRYWKPFQAKLQELRKLEAVSMDFSKYPRPGEDTGAGVHLSAGFAHPFGENEGLWTPLAIELRVRGLTWAKIGDMGGTSVKPCKVLLEQGLMPVVRMYQQRPYIHRWEPKEKETLAALAALGVQYIEDDNERNLIEEWPQGQWPGSNIPFEALVDAWYERGQYVTGLGMFYAIPSLAPGGHYDDITYLLNWLRAMKLGNGAMSMMHDWGWVSVHPAALNHPLDYPDDTINQVEHPGQTIHTHYYSDGRATGASNCWRKWEAVEKIVSDSLGFPLPILATEGGAWPGSVEDGRYPALSEQEASNRQAQMLYAMKTAPAYFLANMPWLLANREMGNLNMAFEPQAWMQAGGKRLPIWEMLRLTPCLRRQTVAIDLQQTIGDAMQPVVIPLNPQAAFERAGAARGMLPASREHDIVADGITYRAQVYRHPAQRDSQHIIYARLGDWANIYWFTRPN